MQIELLLLIKPQTAYAQTSIQNTKNGISDKNINLQI